MDDLAGDLTWFNVVISGDGKGWSIDRSFGGGDDFRRWSRRGCFVGRVDKGDG